MLEKSGKHKQLLDHHIQPRLTLKYPCKYEELMLVLAIAIISLKISAS